MLCGMYELEEVSALSGLAVSTLREYTSYGKSTLVRGRDYVVLRRFRFGRCDRKTLVMKRGLQRIITRDFRSMTKHAARSERRSQTIIERWVDECLSVNLASPRSREGQLRRKQYRMAYLARELLRNPCIENDCHCRCHELVYQAYQVDPDSAQKAQKAKKASIASKDKSNDE